MTPPPVWRFGSRTLELDRPRILGILNVTPDSFSDGGRFLDASAALRHAEQMATEGADLLDVGGESSRPGSEPVSAAEELRRILPVIRGACGLGLPISVDTTKAEVARAALEAGAEVINDISALSDPGMAAVAAGAGAGVILMHMQGRPATMQADPHYDDVVAEVTGFLAERRDRARTAGIAAESIVLDPGIGFGKRLEHNLALLAGLKTLVALGSPVLIGASRKRFIGELTGNPDPEAREAGSLAVVLAARERGASLFRVHDVAATRRALSVFEAVRTV
jgi:dihydropteroate synthase